METGEILNIAKRTVDEHAQTAMRKLGAASRTQAVVTALRDRLFEVQRFRVRLNRDSALAFCWGTSVYSQSAGR